MLLAWIFTIVFVLLIERLFALATKVYPICKALLARLSKLGCTFALVRGTIDFIRVISLSLIGFKHSGDLVKKGFLLLFLTHTKSLFKALAPIKLIALRAALITLIWMHCGWDEYHPIEPTESSPEAHYAQD